MSEPADPIDLRPTPEQVAAWTKAAGVLGVEEWLCELADRAAAPRTEPITVVLRKPVKYGGREVTQLTLRPLKGKDMRRFRASDGDMGNALNFASYLSGDVSQVIDELEGDDLREVIEAVNGFFLAFHGTGPTR